MGSTETPVNCFTSNEIDLKSTSAQASIFTFSDTDVVPLLMTFRITDQNGLISAAVMSMGTNSPNYNNLVNAAVIAGVGVGNTLAIPLAAGAPKLPGGSTVYAKVSVAGVATGNYKCLAYLTQVHE